MSKRKSLILVLAIATLIQLCVPCCVLSGHCSFSKRSSAINLPLSASLRCSCCSNARNESNDTPELPDSPLAPSNCPLCEQPVNLIISTTQLEYEVTQIPGVWRTSDQDKMEHFFRRGESRFGRFSSARDWSTRSSSSLMRMQI